MKCKKCNELEIIIKKLKHESISNRASMAKRIKELSIESSKMKKKYSALIDKYNLDEKKFVATPQKVMHIRTNYNWIEKNEC